MKVTNVCECSLLQMDRLEEPGEVWLNRQCSWKSRDFRLGASLYYLVGETALS